MAMQAFAVVSCHSGFSTRCCDPAPRAQAARRTSPAKKGKTYERPGLSEEEIEEIREAFNLFDTDGSGMRARHLCVLYEPFRQCSLAIFQIK